MNLILRAVIAVMGMISLFTAFVLWFNQGAMVTNLGVETTGIIGRQTLRADVAGLFLGMGIFMVMAAWKQSTVWAKGALILASGAIAGRLIGLLVDGSGQGVWEPIAVEAVVIALLFAAVHTWRGNSVR